MKILKFIPLALLLNFVGVLIAKVAITIQLAFVVYTELGQFFVAFGYHSVAVILATIIAWGLCDTK